MEARRPLRAGTRCSFWSSVAFDASIYEIFAALLVGGTLYVVPEDVRGDPQAVVAWLGENRIGSAYLPPFMLDELLAAAKARPGDLRLERLMTGAEPISQVLASALVEHLPGLCLVNAYGPTEATVVSTAWNVPPGLRDECRAPIGLPLANTRAYVLDGRLEPVAIGEPGELYVAGPGVAEGYVGQPALTAERFLPDPFAAVPGARMYETGDLVRRRGDGDLVFVGRVDRQVKIRGIRVEPGEAEAALARHPDVAEVAVAPFEHDGARSLVAFVSFRRGARVPSRELRRFLQSRLPSAMVPSAFVALEALPRTPGGKIDYRALSRPTGDVADEASALEQEPVTGTEEAVAEVWEELLGPQAIGPSDDFFDMGGDSLLAAQVAARLRDGLLPTASVRDVFTAPTVRELAQLIDEKRGAGPGD
jgi:acyl-coenzyme A synthetase/AMP-(fatty) acid ligase